MPVTPGLQATLALVLPLLAAAPFVLLAAYFVALALRTRVGDRATRADAHDLPATADADAHVEEQDEALPPLGTVARRAHDEAAARARAFDFTDAGVRVGDGASVLRFGLEALPTGRPAFRANLARRGAYATRAAAAPWL
jgi:hypothetical protein